MNLSSTLGFSPRLPVSVYGTGTYNLKFRGFSWKPLGALSLCPKTPCTIGLSPSPADLPTGPIATTFNELFRQFAALSSLRHPITIISSTGILTRWPSTVPFGFALGPD